MPPPESKHIAPTLFDGAPAPTISGSAAVPRTAPTPPASAVDRGDIPATRDDGRPREFTIIDCSGRVERYEDGHLVAVDSQRPARVQPGWSCATAEQPPNVHHHGDESLARLAKTYRRAIEDGRADVAEDLRVITALQRIRLRLRMRYGARDAYGPAGDQGTDVREHWEKFNEPPSYALAFVIDRERFNAGRSHIVKWAS